MPVTQQAPNNLLAFFMERTAEGSRVAARYKTKAGWQDVTWGALLERVRKAAAGLSALGVSKGDRVAIYANTRFEWAVANLAAHGVGAVVVPIYASSTAEEAEYVLKDSDAKAVFVDNDQSEGRAPGRWTRIKQVRERLPELKVCIAMEGASRPEEGLLSLVDLEEKGAAAARPNALEEQARALGADDLGYIFYTSGTTGRPKGVMLTHGNWATQANAVGLKGVELIQRDDVVLLFLPLAHVLALVAYAAWLGQGMVLAFAESIERAVDNAAEVKATVMPAVPRVFEKAYNRVIADAGSQPGIKGKLFAWAMGEFEQYVAARSAGKSYDSLQWALAKRLVFSKVQEKLSARFGGRMRHFISGGAPLGRKIAYFFDVCGLKVLEGYGLTETCAPTHCNRPFANRIGSVGQPFPGVQVRLADDGEILVKGAQVMQGYYKLPQETAATLEDGWLHTGDIGEVDAEGYLKITDRKKDLIKTSGGKYIAPQELENALKTEPLVSQVMVHGDRRKFVSALITISEENARKWAKEQNVPFGSYAELTQRPEVRARIKAAVDALNATQASYAAIKQFVVLDHDWSQETGELTPSLKIKRKDLNAKYKHVLDGIYGEKTE